MIKVCWTAWRPYRGGVIASNGKVKPIRSPVLAWAKADNTVSSSRLFKVPYSSFLPYTSQEYATPILAIFGSSSYSGSSMRLKLDISLRSQEPDRVELLRDVSKRGFPFPK